MFKIYDGRNCFFQWDLNQKLIVFDDSITEVHFYNGVDTCALVCEVYESGDLRLVNVPNILLQSDFKLKVWAYAEDYTKQEFTFKVCTRSKPADYIYTETEVKSYEKFEERLQALEEAQNIDLSEYVKLTDIADRNKLGVVSCGWGFGVGVNKLGNLFTEKATNEMIDEKINDYAVICPSNLEYAVNSVVGKQIGDIDTALNRIIAIQDGYIYNTMSLGKGGEE
jgi:hypothetical protein